METERSYLDKQNLLFEPGQRLKGYLCDHVIIQRFPTSYDALPPELQAQLNEPDKQFYLSVNIDHPSQQLTESMELRTLVILNNPGENTNPQPAGSKPRTIPYALAKRAQNIVDASQEE